MTCQSPGAWNVNCADVTWHFSVCDIYWLAGGGSTSAGGDMAEGDSTTTRGNVASSRLGEDRPGRGITPCIQRLSETTAGVPAPSRRTTTASRAGAGAAPAAHGAQRARRGQGPARPRLGQRGRLARATDAIQQLCGGRAQPGEDSCRCASSCHGTSSSGCMDRRKQPVWGTTGRFAPPSRASTPATGQPERRDSLKGIIGRRAAPRLPDPPPACGGDEPRKASSW